MNVFLAWSGPVSHGVAQALRKWLPSVLQKVKPFLSSTDIGKGERWRNELAKQVETASFAILCLTPDNLSSTWIHFEAGAVSRQAHEGRVTALLVGVKAEQVVDPLAQFQNTPATKLEVKKLVQKLNSLFGGEQLQESLLDDSFETYWPRLENAMAEAQRAGGSAAPAPRPIPDMLAEILENSRNQGRTLTMWLDMQQRMMNDIGRLGGFKSWPGTALSTLVRHGAKPTDGPGNPLRHGKKFQETLAKFLAENQGMTIPEILEAMIVQPAPPSAAEIVAAHHPLFPEFDDKEK